MIADAVFGVSCGKTSSIQSKDWVPALMNHAANSVGQQAGAVGAGRVKFDAIERRFLDRPESRIAARIFGRRFGNDFRSDRS